MVAASSAGHSGAASATWEHVHRHFAVAALFVARNAAMYLCGKTIELHVDFDATGAWRHHVSMRPSSRNQSAATTALTAGIGELFIVKRLREIPHWWILGRCAPPISSVSQLSEAALCLHTRPLRLSLAHAYLGENQTKPSQLQPAPPRRGPWRQAPAQVPWCRRRHKGRRACAAPRAIRVRVEGHRRRRSQANTSFGHSKKNVLVFETGGCVSHCVSTVYPD